MTFEEVYLVSDDLKLVTDSVVRMAEARLQTSFPSGYPEYVTTLGSGEYNGIVRVALPNQILDEYVVQQETWAEHADLYESYFDVIPLPRLVQAIKFATTEDGVKMVFHPDSPDQLYVLGYEHAYRVGTTLQELLDWVVESGQITGKDHTMVLAPTGQFVEQRFRYFELDKNRALIQFESSSVGSFNETRDFLIAWTRDNLARMTCVIHSEKTEYGELEWVQLLGREFAGQVRCIAPVPEEEVSSRIDLTYDVTRETDSLRFLVKSLGAFGYRADSIETYGGG